MCAQVGGEVPVSPNDKNGQREIVVGVRVLRIRVVPADLNGSTEPRAETTEIFKK